MYQLNLLHCNIKTCFYHNKDCVDSLVNHLLEVLFMQTLFSSLVKRLHKVYRKAEAFIEEERDFTLSQTFLNATLERYVTNNVEFLDDLHADLYHDWLRLYATMHVKGLETTLSVDLKLIQMEFNKEQQLIVLSKLVTHKL